LRISFDAGGNILGIEAISGHQLLVKSTSEQLRAWRLRINIAGDQPCQSLIVVKYRIFPENYSAADLESTRKPHVPIGIYQIWVDTYTIVLSDPAPTLTRKHRFLIF
jgi:hypothetical protein